MKKMVRLPFSNMDLAVAKILVQAHYLREARKKVIDKKSFLEIDLPSKGSGGTLNDFKIFSKPGRRLYKNYRNLKPVRQGYGLAVLSTPKGIMDNIEARKNKVGGEYLFEIW